MNMYDVEIVETIIKRVAMPAENATDAMYLASELEDDGFDFCESVNGKATAFLLGKTDDEDDKDDDPCDGFDDCDDCPNYCEVCGSCAKEADFVPNRGDCADCKHRCSACGACTADD